MDLTQSSLQTILSTIFNVDAKYIVPKQGTWFNPQVMLTQTDRPETWIAYRIKTVNQRALPFYMDDTVTVNNTTTDVNYVMSVKKSEIQLQIVGKDAESLAYSIGSWTKRMDVDTAFLTVNGKLMLDDFNVIPTDFYQDGINNILAYNVGFSILWYNQIATSQQIVDTITIQ